MRRDGSTFVLSRRNLAALIHMLDHRDKAAPALAGRDMLVCVDEDGEIPLGATGGAVSLDRSTLEDLARRFDGLESGTSKPIVADILPDCTIVVESDAEHYAGREPGVMSWEVST